MEDTEGCGDGRIFSGMGGGKFEGMRRSTMICNYYILYYVILL